MAGAEALHAVCFAFASRFMMLALALAAFCVTGICKTKLFETREILGLSPVIVR